MACTDCPGSEDNGTGVAVEIPNGPDYSQFKIVQSEDGSWTAVTPEMRVTAFADIEPSAGSQGVVRAGPLFHRREIKKRGSETEFRSALMCELPHPDGGEPYRIYFRWNSVVITRQILDP